MTNILRSISFLIVFGFFATQAYGQACSGQTEPAESGLVPEVLPQIGDDNSTGSQEVTFKLPSIIVFDLNTEDFTDQVPNQTISFDVLVESLQIDTGAFVVLQEGTTQPSLDASAESVSDNAPSNSTWTATPAAGTDYVGCMTVEYTASATGQYIVNFRPLLAGKVVATDVPALVGAIIGVSNGDTVATDTIDNFLNGIPGATPEIVETVVGQITRPAPGTMQSRFGYNQAVGVSENLLAAYNMSIFPNPVNDASVVRYTLKETTDMSITMTDATGRVVSNVFSGQQTAGQYEQALCADCGSLPAGVYFVHVVAGQQSFASCVVVR